MNYPHLKKNVARLICSAALGFSIQGPALAQWVDLDLDNDSRGRESSLDQVDKVQQIGPARQRAVNLARSYAVEVNGGLSSYRPNSCMFSSSATGCLISYGNRGFLFKFTGGAPGWQQLGLAADKETEILISPDGRSIIQLIYNGPPR